MKLWIVCIVLFILVACGRTPPPVAEPPPPSLLLLGCHIVNEVEACIYLGLFEGPTLCAVTFVDVEVVDMVCGVKLAFPAELKDAVQ